MLQVREKAPTVPVLAETGMLVGGSILERGVPYLNLQVGLVESRFVMTRMRTLGFLAILLAFTFQPLVCVPGEAMADGARQEFPDPSWERLRGNASITLGRAMGPPRDEVGLSEEAGGDGRADNIIEVHLREGLAEVKYIEVVTVGPEKFAWDSKPGNELPLCLLLVNRKPVKPEADNKGFSSLGKGSALTILVQDDKHLTWRGDQRTFVLFGLPGERVKYVEMFIIFTD
jgi:hypothetical protein